MGIEIERKFLVQSDDWPRAAAPVPIRQGYLAASQGVSIRVRLAGRRATLTVKTERLGMTRDEFEYEVPHDDGVALLRLATGPLIEKTRHDVRYAGRDWVIDVFEGRHQGLVLAEIELEHELAVVDLPPWAGREVTDDVRYRNSVRAKLDSAPS